MAVKIDVSSIRIRIKNPNLPYVRIEIRTEDFLKGSRFIRNGRAVFRLSADVEIGAKALFTMDALDDLVDWKLGFLQIFREPGRRYLYTGRTPSEGSITWNMQFEPSTWIDSYDLNMLPWYRNTPEALFKGSPADGHGSGKLVDISMVDYPFISVPLALDNKATNVYNFLYKVTGNWEFWTILTAIAPIGTRQHLGYCHWCVRWKANFVWQSGVAQPTNWSSLTRLDQDKGEFVPGSPPDADVQKILANPVGPTANDGTREVVYDAVKGPNSWSHLESKKGISPIPRDFWTGSLPANVA